MVIRIMIEGGVLPNRKDATISAADKVLDGSEVLREELKKFFTKVLGFSDISIVVSYEASNKNAAKAFIAHPEEDYLYADLDDVPERRARWFDRMAQDGIVIPADRKDDVYFWIQEMEA